MSLNPSFLFKGNKLNLAIIIVLFCQYSTAKAADYIEFNTDSLDINDKQNIDLSKFSYGNYIMPGEYNMALVVNNRELDNKKVKIYQFGDNDKQSRICLNKLVSESLGFKENTLKNATWWHDNECLDESSISGMTIDGDLATSSININIPQAYVEYVSQDWDPPSRWDDGIPGILFDYNVNAQKTFRYTNSFNDQSLSGNGVAGINAGTWRFRADWQARYSRTGSAYRENSFDWNRYYAYRAVRSLGAKLTVGEDYLSSNIFDNFKFGGVSLVSDDNMLPPNLRGYAPEITGVAKTNAKVIVMQQDRVLYETQVASGPFRIQDLNDATSGELKVRVEEQDGSVQEFQVNTANIPYLTRPGMVRYKLAAGQSTDSRHHYKGPIFGTGEFSWGINNGWSLYGGGVFGGDYNALAIGIGRDLLALGAISFDITSSRAKLPGAGTQDGQEKFRGESYRLSYSKSFDELDSQITFAGYRFSEKDYMSMSEYLDTRYSQDGKRNGGSKEIYTVSYSQQISALDLSAYLNYDRQTYWNEPANDRYNLTLSKYFATKNTSGVYVSLSGYRNKYQNKKDDGFYLSVSIPLDQKSTISYNLSADRGNVSQKLGYFNRINDRSNYQLSVGSSRNGLNASSYYTYDGDMARANINANYQNNQYTAFGLNAQGGVTLTRKGSSVHRVMMPGSTRLLIDTDNVANVPIKGYGNRVNSNYLGIALVPDINSYYRNQIGVDLDKVKGDYDVGDKSVVQATLTEGAIGYKTVDIISGAKGMAILKLADGSSPPFGATVTNSTGKNVGIVDDNGYVYLRGIKPLEKMKVNFGNDKYCTATIPNELSSDSLITNLFLLCSEPTEEKKLINLY